MRTAMLYMVYALFLVIIATILLSLSINQNESRIDDLEQRVTAQEINQ